MSKKLIHGYTFSNAANTIVIPEIVKKERFLLITNTTTGNTLYQFNCAEFGFEDITYDFANETTTVTLGVDCNAMANTDSIQIFVEKDFQNIEFTETYIDPVSKIRVSLPENLIDTDFEYGLQSQKWETIELVKNIPTFFSRTGETSFDIIDVLTTDGSDLVTLTLNSAHNIDVGAPVLVSGTTNITCDGTFIVTAIISSTSFQYRAKATQTFTGSIFSPNVTQAFPGSRYQGTEFTLSTIQSITTDSNAVSSLTVTTQFPTNFIANTSFYLTNSVAPVNYLFDASLAEPNNYNLVTGTTTNNANTGEIDGFAKGAVQPYDYTGIEGFFFDSDDIVGVNTTATTGEFIQFNRDHGLTDNRPYVYVPGELNTAIGGLTAFAGYYIRTVNANTIYFTTAVNGTTRVNLTSAGAFAGIHRSGLLRAYKASSAVTATASEYINFVEPHGEATLSYQPVAFFNGTAGGMTASTNLGGAALPVVYYTRTASTANRLSFSTTSGGGNFNISSTGATAYMVKIAQLTNRNSIFFENHGLSTDDVILFYSPNSGTIPTGLANNTNYRVETVSGDRIRLKSNETGAVIDLTTAGSAAAVYNFDSRTSNTFSDTIYIQNHGLNDGSPIRYNDVGGTTIGGLTSNATQYYVFTSTVDRIRLSTTVDGWKTAARSFTQNPTNVVVSTNRITATAHGFSNGDAVQYLSQSPVSGLTNGAWYWARATSANVVELYWTQEGAIGGWANSIVDLVGTPSGTGSLRAAFLVDVTAPGDGQQKLQAVSQGVADGVYTLTQAVSSNTFVVQANNQVLQRDLTIIPEENIDLSTSSIRYENHYFGQGTPVVYTTDGTDITGLSSGTTYYISRLNTTWFQLANTFNDAVSGNYIELSGFGSGTHLISTNTISGEVQGSGTVSANAFGYTIDGVDTNFTAQFVPGDTFTVFRNEVATLASVTATAATDAIALTSHGLTDGDPVQIVVDGGGSAPGGTSNNYIYYARTTDVGTPANNFTLYPTPVDAVANTNKIDITDAGTSVRVRRWTEIGNSISKVISYVNSPTEITVRSDSGAFDVTTTDTNYAINTALLIRADGFAIHRPYDGGVELTPSKNPDSMMIRQTRKYFRYQSGKGIQVSFAVNFSPTVSIMSFTRSGTTGTITTRNPHKISTGLNITVNGATVTGGTNYWNAVFAVQSIIDDYSFTVTLAGTPADSEAGGIVEYYVNSWSGSLLKCGLFDDQNGLYFEYNGSTLNCCRRSSTQQISGTVAVTFKSCEVVGTGTKFTSQLAANDKIVIKGQSYLVSEILSDTRLFVLPSYRGITAQNIVVTKTVDTKIPQNQWNIDVCDGYGPTGYYLDLNKIQMAYMDYSWYGAGKVRFGFKDQRGRVVYVHEFIHNNKFTEAYLRSGNLPARYEIENVGEPSYVPALAHWGTSVIMDGRFDDDKAYVFTASGQTLAVSGDATVTVNARVESTSLFQVRQGGSTYTAGYALTLSASNTIFNSLSAGNEFDTSFNIPAATQLELPTDTRITPRQPYLPGVSSRITGINPFVSRNLLILDRQPSSSNASFGNFVVNLGAITNVVYNQPLISIRLAPSVDNSTTGGLGVREIINRMQLILSQVGILTSHTAEISLVLNGQIDNNAWQRVSAPSLSQLVYHDSSDRIQGGTTLFSFRAGGDTGTSRTAQATTQDLGELATLGNSILGGDNIYPDGPDILTVVARLVEDPSSVSATNPFTITGRISWSESQA